MTDVYQKERIKQAAHDLVMKYSIRSVSMDDIAASVGMSKKTLYHYYKDKDELVEAVIDSVIEGNRCKCDLHVKEADNAVHQIFLTMEMMVEMFKTMNPAILYEMQKYHPEAHQHFQQHKMQYLLGHIEKNIERGIAEELYRPEINVHILAKFRIESMFIPFHPEFQRSLGKYTLIEIEEQIITNFLFGLVTQKGYKLALKYITQRERKVSNNK
ncbi:MAG: TetR/AcrR family transcriptional regulator [Ferruginibacter sp.]